MSFWFWHGLRNRIRSTRYPRAAETAPGVTPGRPVATRFARAEESSAAVAICPVHAIASSGNQASVDHRTCIWCERCRYELDSPMAWEMTHDWSGKEIDRGALPRTFRRSLHIFIVDAGDCGACLNEARQLNNPFYNIHRLGLFLTATPRTADVLLVVGPVSENMRGPLLKTYAAMPEPKRVLAVGTCALSGGVFGRSFICAGGVGNVLPVDLEVPGDPPPPLAILHGLLRIAGHGMPDVAAKRLGVTQ